MPKTRRPFPTSWKVRLFIAVYHGLWHLLLPVVLVLLWRKGAKEPLYRQHWGERFGRIPTTLVRPLWFHSASMGELRGAAPLIRALLARGERIVVTTFTPAGRKTGLQLFAEAIERGQLQMAYVPLELSWAVARFLRRVQPRAAIMTEIDTWPVLLRTAHRVGIPLALANGQYPKKSLERDLRWWGLRSGVFQAYDRVLCKSETHAERFRRVGCTQVDIVGETRFDLPIPPHQLAAAARLVDRAGWHPQQRAVMAVASAVDGEDPTFLGAFDRLRRQMVAAGMAAPLLVYVPRSPQRFDAVAETIQARNWQLIRRSTAFDADLQPITAVDWSTVDVLLGDSLGEMSFYLALSHAVVVGASFVNLGSHNVIEPLALKKPVMVGPSIWGIEYPGVEAIAAGVLQQVSGEEALAQAMHGLLTDPDRYRTAIEGVEAFCATHAGSTEKHLQVLLPWLEPA